MQGEGVMRMRREDGWEVKVRIRTDYLGVKERRCESRADGRNVG